jgi:hypothetical protein
VNDSLGTATNYATSAVADTQAGATPSVGSNNQVANRPDLYFVVRSGAGATDIANCQVYCGLVVNNAGTINVKIPPNCIAFNFNSRNRSDVNWQTITADASVSVGEATNFIQKDTGIAYTANTLYQLRITVTGDTTVEFRINDILVSTHSGSGMPAINTALLYAANLITGSATIRNFRFTVMNVRSK